jgi:hypothetical protein
VDQPFTGRLSGVGWFGKRLPLASCQSSWIAVFHTQMPFGSNPAWGTDIQVWSIWQFVGGMQLSGRWQPGGIQHLPFSIHGHELLNPGSKGLWSLPVPHLSCVVGSHVRTHIEPRHFALGSFGGDGDGAPASVRTHCGFARMGSAV